MTTMVHQKPPAKAAATPQPKLLYVEVDSIDLGENVRKNFDKAKDEELAQSVKAHGIINPLTLIPNPAKKGRFLLVAGHRRLNAAKVAGLKEVPATVRESNDAELVQIVENIQRKDLEPIEEARGLKKLLDSKKYTIEQLAEMVDRSAAYVYRSVKLLELPEKAIKAIEEGKLTPAHGHQLLRAPADKRQDYLETALEEGWDGAMSATELRNSIEQELGSSLSDAKFPKDKPYAGQAACTGCQSNSGNQGMLFDGAEKGTCMLKACFVKKTAQYWDDVVAKLKELGAEVIVSQHYLYEHQSVGSRVVGKEITRDQIKRGQVIALSKGSGKIHATTEKKQAARRGGSQEEQRDWERDNAINQAGQSAFFTAYAKKAREKKFGKEQLVALAVRAANQWQYCTKSVIEAWGWKKVDAAALKKLSESELIGLVYVLTLNDSEYAKAIGIDTSEEVKKAKADAAKAYDEAKQKGAKKK